MLPNRSLVALAIIATTIASTVATRAAEIATLDAPIEQGPGSRPGPAAPPGDGVWRPLGIGRHSGHTAMYDPRRDEMVVYGGDLGYNDVWALALSGRLTWRLVAPAERFYPPEGLQSPTAVLDPVRDRLVTFGGYWPGPDSDGEFVDFLHTVTLSGRATWATLRPPTRGACGRVHGRAFFDPVRDRMLVMGGWWEGGFCDGPSSDVWALSLGTSPEWSRLPAIGTPPEGGLNDVAVYDSARRRIITLGSSIDWFEPSPGLWSLSLTDPPTWTRITPSGTPPTPRTGHSAIYDPIGDRVVVFGGGTWRKPTDEVWALELAGTPRWMPLAPAGPAPSRRSGHSAIYDPVRRRMLVYGADSTSGSREVWALELSGELRWNPVVTSGTLDPPPGGLVFPPAIQDPARDQIVFFEQAPGRPLDRLQALALEPQPRWTDHPLTGPTPIGRSMATAIRDPHGGDIIVFGGADATGVPSDELWSLSMRGRPRWEQLTPAGPSPPARSGHSALYDPVRRRMLVFGGRARDGQWLHDVWSLALSPRRTWTELQAVGAAPQGTWGHAAYYDPGGDRMMVYIGNTGTELERQVWALALAGTPTWSRLTSSSDGEVPTDPILPTIHDPDRDRLLVINTRAYCERIFPMFPDEGCNGVWALGPSHAPVWRALRPGGARPLPLLQMALYDPDRERLLVVGQWSDHFEIRALEWGREHRHEDSPDRCSTNGSAPPASAVRDTSWELIGPRPDPAAGGALLSFTVPQVADISLTLFDLLGRRIAVLAEGRHEPGRYQVPCNGPAGRGTLPPGVYLARLATPIGAVTRRFVVVR